MLELSLPTAHRRATRILCLGAHCDDIEIGCGGTLLKLLSGPGRWDVTWVTFSATPQREREWRASARRFLRRASHATLIPFEFTDGFFPGEYSALKKAFVTLKELPSPDIVFTHHRQDLHQDHRLVGKLTLNTFRQHLLLEYEVPKYEGGLTTPNAYVSLSRGQVATKVRALLECYLSQKKKSWFTADTFEAMVRLRGVEAGPGTRWAEGFHVSKFRIG